MDILVFIFLKFNREKSFTSKLSCVRFCLLKKKKFVHA